MPDLGIDLVKLLLKEGYCHDYTLVCHGEEKLKVHRVILAARSVVLKTMVDVDMVERRTNTIEIKEFDAEVVKEFINFLYSDRISGDFSNFTELMKIGHQYQVFSLMEECAKHLVQEISTENIAQLGTLAEALEAVELSEKCAEFVAENFEKVDKDTLDSVPSSIYRKSFEAYRASKQMTEDAVPNEDYMVNFFTGLGDPIIVKENSSIYTSFRVKKSSASNVKLTGVGLYISKDKIPIEMTLSHSNMFGTPCVLMTMSTIITSTDCSKPLKINIPSSVSLGGFENVYRLEIKLGKECINFKGDGTKNIVKIPMKDGDIEFQQYLGSIGVPVLYFEK